MKTYGSKDTHDEEIDNKRYEESDSCEKSIHTCHPGMANYAEYLAGKSGSCARINEHEGLESKGTM